MTDDMSEFFGNGDGHLESFEVRVFRVFRRMKLWKRPIRIGYDPLLSYHDYHEENCNYILRTRQDQVNGEILLPGALRTGRPEQDASKMMWLRSRDNRSCFAKGSRSFDELQAAR